MGVPNVVYKWSSLKILYVTVFVMNVAGFVIVVVMIVSAINLKKGFGDYLNLVTPGDGYLWPALIVLAAFLCAPIYAVGIKLCIRLKFYRHSADTLPRFNQYLFLHSVLCFVSVFLVVGINAASIVHSNTFHHRIHDGLIEAMRDYAGEIVAKIRVDMIQIKFHCCGSKTYKEWFYIPWLQGEAENTETRQIRETNSSQFVSADVPFSCCSTEILKPCIHHNILRPSDVYIYDPQHRLTIATTGCQSKILAHASSVGNLLIFALLLLSVYQMTLALLSRLLQTAHSNTLYIGPKKSRYLAWILGSIPSTEVYNKLVYKNEEAPDEDIPRPSNVDATITLTPDGEGKESADKCKNIKNKLLQKMCSKLSTKSKSIDVEGPSSTSLKASGEEPTAGLVPTPPPSPDSIRKLPGGPDAGGVTGVRESKVSKIAKELSKSLAVSPPVKEKPGSILPSKERKESEGKRGDKKGIKDKIRELRESLQHLNDVEPPWKGGTPDFDMGNAPQVDRFNNHPRYPTAEQEKGQRRRETRPCVTHPAPLVNTRDRHTSFPEQRRDPHDSDECPDQTRPPGRSRPLAKGDQRYRRHSRDPDRGRSSSRSSRSHRDCLCQKDSIDEDKSRLKKFCKDLSTEYNRSSFSRQRKEFSEPNRWNDRMGDNRDIRTQVCAKFNPSDTYSRFRGSEQDTMRRREDQMQTRRPPPLIPVRGRPKVMRPWSQKYPKNIPFLPRQPSYPTPQLPLPLPPQPQPQLHQHMLVPSQMWPQQQQQQQQQQPPLPWSTYCPQPQGYFPPAPRSPDPPIQRPTFSYPYPPPYPDPPAARPLGCPNEGPRPRFPGRCPMPPGIGEPPRFCGC